MLDLKSQNYKSNGKSKDIKIRAYDFSIEIIRFVNLFPNKRAFWIIADQLIRSATSVGANMIEAQASSSRRDFIKFYEIALKSSNEAQYWLNLLKDSAPELSEKCEELIKENLEISKMIASSVLTLKGKRSFKI